MSSERPTPPSQNVEMPEVHTVRPERRMGNLTDAEVLNADMGKLTELVAQSSERMLGKVLTPQELFLQSAWRDMSRENSFRYAWTKDNLIRLALFILDGRSRVEIAKAFNTRRNANEKISNVVLSTVASKHFSDEIKKAGQKVFIMRKWDNLLFPQNKQAEIKLRKLEQKYGLDRHLIFSNPVGKGEAGERVKSRQNESPTLFDPEFIISLLYNRFYVGATSTQLRQQASTFIGRPLSKSAVHAVFSSALTPQARALFGIREKNRTHSLKKEDFEQIAKRYIERGVVNVGVLGTELQKPKNLVYKNLKAEGNRLMRANAAYAHLPWLAALLLEYGSFPEGSNKELRARELADEYSRLQKGKE